jgi:8-oxo-dGTP pyrophosphatase MutT (NUDIX family)
MRPTKACPIVLRGKAPAVSILAFTHPTAGKQLVKGTIEANESPADAAIRELWEEAGVRGTVLRDLGIWDSRRRHQLWSFHLCQSSEPLPDFWSHHCADGGGHLFEFFWQPLQITPSEGWHPVHLGALDYARQALASTAVRRPA